MYKTFSILVLVTLDFFFFYNVLFLKHLPFLVTCGQRRENILFLRMFIKSLPKGKGLEDERERMYFFFLFLELLCLNFLDSGLGTLSGDKQGSLSLVSWWARLGRTRFSWGVSVPLCWCHCSGLCPQGHAPGDLSCYFSSVIFAFFC